MFVKTAKSVSLFLVLCFAVSIIAFAATQQQEKKSGNVTVTGCLQKGDEANEFSITGDDGKLYDLRSSSVKLAEHVGHKVTVSGRFKAEGNEKDEDEARESKESGKKEAGDIQVSNLKMVSSSCQ
jgi:preprotein translocase subunit YajC